MTQMPITLRVRFTGRRAEDFFEEREVDCVFQLSATA